MSKIWKKILGISCAAVIGCSALVGCGGGDDEIEVRDPVVYETGSIQNYQWVEDESWTVKSIYEKDKYRDVYSKAASPDDGKLTYFNWTADGVNTASSKNTSIYQKLVEKAGMEIETQVVSEWESTIATKFGAGKLPDIFVHYGPERPEDYQLLIEDGAILPVSDFVDETHWPNIYNHLKKFDYLRGNLSYSQGKHWSIPVDWTLEHTMYVRLDWIENLNNKIATVMAEEQGRSESSFTAAELEAGKFTATGPKDLLEFYRLCRAFTLHDPDGNGEADTYGYIDSRGEGDFFTDCWIFEAFDAGYDRMVEVGGEYVSSYANDNTEKALAFMNNLFQNGYMHPGFTGATMSDKQDYFANGTVGIIEGHAWYNTILTNFVSANNGTWAKGLSNEEAIEEGAKRVGVFNPPTGETGHCGINGNPNFWTVTCISAALSDEELEAALNLIDYLLSDEGQSLMTYGVENEHYTLDNSKTDYTKYQAEGALNNKDKSGYNVTLSSVDGAASIGCMVNWSFSYLSPYATNADKILSIMENAESYHTYADYPFLSTNAYVEYWQDLKTLANQTFNTIIKTKVSTTDWKGSSLTYANLSNTSNIHSMWEDYMNNFENTGGKTMVEEYNLNITPYTAVGYSK